jgi:hypothetical protein
MKPAKRGDPTKPLSEMANINIIRELVVPLKSHTKRWCKSDVVPLFIEFLDNINIKITHKILTINT